ncbi:MAG: PKD domain-containing protein [Spirochaetia bacterium]|nr:PKD domain-containing protein [Spirochaetia bacterium]
MKRSRTTLTYLAMTLGLLAISCKTEKEDPSTQLAPLLLSMPLIQSAPNQSTCAGPGSLPLFTDPMPPENEILTLHLGESIVLDQANQPGSPNLVWDFFAGTEYLGFYQRFARHVQAEQCASYTPTFPGFHYLKLCNSQACLARGIIKVEGQMNRAPVARAAPIPLVVPVGVGQTLDLSASTDPENDELKFEWKILIKPAGSSAVAPTSGPAVQSFTPDQPGKYFLMSRARDGFENPFRFLDEANSQISALLYARIPGNQAPTISLGMTPSNPTESTAITFDASASTDQDDAELKIHYWSLIRLNDWGSWELDRESDQFTDGQLTFTIAPTAGTYQIYVCLADYVGRDFGLEGEEQSCTYKEFVVAP